MRMELPGQVAVAPRRQTSARVAAAVAGAAWPPLILTLPFWPPNTWMPGPEMDWRLMILLVGLIAHNLKESMPWVWPSFEELCTATALDVSLVRVMTQLMTEQDYEDPHLAALSLYMHGPEGVSRPSYPWVLTSPRGRQLQENASRASVTSQLLELQRPTSPTDIYALMHNILHPNAPHALVENQVTNTSSSVDFTMS